ncbi:cobyric acid synthase [Candidatus Uhrbacteria bacterium]|nr:cobyric acid synthase [Candidatus Uhrbacteria bacterium]
MPAKTLMVQGTASSVGKSIMVTALCRILKQDGWRVTPFKAQNMSLNSFVTCDGGEIGRAQVVQAEAAGVEPTVEMNPILLKPEADNCSQVVVKGKPMGRVMATEYYSSREQLWSVVTESLDKLSVQYEVVLIEGAGSPAEVNLKDRDMVNMRVALHCQAPVLLVADIDRGGVFASLVGTLGLLEPEERALVKAFVINKFRGDLSLLEPGLKWLEDRTRIPVAGVIPYYHDIHVAEEDSISLERRRTMKRKSDYILDIAVIGLPHISNFDDFDPLEQEEGVRLRYVEPNDELGEPDLIIIPGTKSTMADLKYLKRIGHARAIIDQAHKGKPVIGICGGYQMLGRMILDPEHVESSETQAEGLGLLPVTTTFSPVKSTHQVRGCVIAGRGLLQEASRLSVSGYEIHMGTTNGANDAAPFRIDERSRRPCKDIDGCLSPCGNVLGTYIHGLFHNEGFRRSLLSELAGRKGVAFHASARVLSKEEQYDRLADLVRNSLDMESIYRMIGLE